MKVIALAAVAAVIACSTAGSPTAKQTADQKVELFWASYQLHAEPRYRLIFEGGTDTLRPTEVRILLPSGSTVASAPTVPSTSDPLRLCGPTKNADARLYGPVRAALPVDEGLFKDFIRQPADFRVEAKLQGQWQATRLTNLCHASE
jgi:hypothetical protein